MAFGLKIGSVYIDFGAEDRRLKRDLNNMKRQTTNAAMDIKKSFNKVIGRIGAGFGLMKAFDFSVAAKNAARDAEEVDNKFREVFKSIEKEAESAARTISREFDLAQSTSKELLGTTGDLLVGFGFTEKQALEMSLAVNRLAVDLASFSNIQGGTEQASMALTKGLLGERESMKLLGIAVNENTQEFKELVKQKRRDEGATLIQAKALATLEIAYKQSGKAVGDYNRTKDSLANKERRVNEQLKESKEILGQALIPIFEAGTEVLSNFAEGLSKITGNWYELNDAIRNDSVRQSIKNWKELYSTLDNDALSYRVDEINKKLGELRGKLILGQSKNSLFMGIDVEKVKADIRTLEAQLIAINQLMGAVPNTTANDSLDKTNAKWTAAGKTIKEIEERIKKLKEEQENLLPGSKELAQNLAQIKGLEFILNTDAVKKAQESLYSELGFMAEGYAEYRKRLIDEMYELLIRSGIAEVDAERWKNEQLKALAEERKAFFDDPIQESLQGEIDFMDELLDKEDELYQKKLEHEENLAEARNSIREEEEKKRLDLIEKEKEAYDTIENELQSFGNTLVSTFGIAGDTFVGKLVSAINIISSIIQMLKSALAIAEAISFITTLSKLATLQSLFPAGILPFGGGRASGGPVKKGVPYKVGERGEELFVPNQSGFIVPNNMLKNDYLIGAKRTQTVSTGSNFNDRNIVGAINLLRQDLGGKIESYHLTVAGSIANRPPVVVKLPDGRALAEFTQTNVNKLKREGVNTDGL